MFIKICRIFIFPLNFPESINFHKKYKLWTSSSIPNIFVFHQTLRNLTPFLCIEIFFLFLYQNGVNGRITVHVQLPVVKAHEPSRVNVWIIKTAQLATSQIVLHRKKMMKKIKRQSNVLLSSPVQVWWNFFSICFCVLNANLMRRAWVFRTSLFIGYYYNNWNGFNNNKNASFFFCFYRNSLSYHLISSKKSS